tara:strand:+ start:2515 stop:3258 length:744 start_codon:yes stop_codon:yes gene_type:complete
MGRSHDLARGASSLYQTQTASDTRYANVSGDTFTGNVNVDGGNFYLNPSNEAAHRYMFLNTGATNDGHILFQRAGSNKFQLAADTSNNLFTWNYTKNGASHRINADGSVITPHQPSFQASGNFGWRDYGGTLTEVQNWRTNQTGYYNSGMLNQTTGRATAPVAGKYLFNFIIYINLSGDTAHYGYPYINGSRFGDNILYHRDESGTYPDNTMGGSVIMSLSANDYVSWYHAYDIYGYHTQWSGHLLG